MATTCHFCKRKTILDEVLECYVCKKQMPCISFKKECHPNEDYLENHHMDRGEYDNDGYVCSWHHDERICPDCAIECDFCGDHYTCKKCANEKPGAAHVDYSDGCITNVCSYCAETFEEAGGSDDNEK